MARFICEDINSVPPVGENAAAHTNTPPTVMYGLPTSASLTTVVGCVGLTSLSLGHQPPASLPFLAKTQLLATLPFCAEMIIESVSGDIVLRVDFIRLHPEVSHNLSRWFLLLFFFRHMNYPLFPLVSLTIKLHLFFYDFSFFHFFGFV